MPVRIDEPGDGTGGIIVEAKDLKDGQIATIFSWSLEGDGYDGAVVMMVGDDFICLNDAGSSSLSRASIQRIACRVRVLPNGATLIVEDNE